MTNQQSPGPAINQTNMPSPFKSIIFAILAAGLIAFTIWSGLQVSATGGAALSEWQKYIIGFIGAIGVLIAGGFSKQTFDNKKNLTGQKDNNDKLNFLTEIMQQQGVEMNELKKQNVLLTTEVRDLKYAVETLSRENKMLKKQAQKNKENNE